ncbi:MAG: cation:proton antiporter [Stellaceae bacterium]
MYQNAAILAAFLLIYGAIAGRVERSWLSGPMVFIAVGLVLGPFGLGFVRLNLGAQGLRTLAELTLAMVLFTDAANADFDIVRRNIGIPERLLLIGLPLTIVFGFLVAMVMFPRIAPLELALLAALLAPTDAALGKPVVTNPTVPSVMREALNIESGLNDGICVPIVVLLLGLAVGTRRIADMGPTRGMVAVQLHLAAVHHPARHRPPVTQSEHLRMGYAWLTCKAIR